MELNILINNIKKNLLENPYIENVIVEDKTYLHAKHSSHDKNKFHVKIIIYSKEFKEMSKINATKQVNKILDEEIKNYIHSIQILFE